MIDDKLFAKIKKEIAHLPNMLSPAETAEFDDGKRTINIAPRFFRNYAQNLIDSIGEHWHLKKAKVLLLVGSSEADEKKLASGTRISVGKARKAVPREKFLSSFGTKSAIFADFIVTVSGDWTDAIGATEGKGKIPLDNERAHRRVIALLDHELLHCGAKIAGEFVAPDELAGFVQDLGKRHIETCDDITRPDGAKLVRFYHVDKTGSLTFCCRKHDVEEFRGVVDRHGLWARDLCRLVDVIKEHTNDEPLFEMIPATAKK